MKNIIEIKNLNYSYPGREIFNGLDLSIKENSFTTITGANGCGKTTLYNILKKELKDKAFFIGEDTKYKDVKVLDYIKDIENYNEYKKIYDIESVLDCYINKLSYSEKRYIDIFKSINSGKDILVFDNAFSFLDPLKKEKIFKLLKKIKKDKKITIVNITSDAEEIVYSTDVVLIENKKVLINKPLKYIVDKEKELKKCSQDLPFIASLSLKLKYYGLVDKIYLENSKLVDALWK